MSTRIQPGEHHEVGTEPGHHVGEAGVVVGPRLVGVGADVHRRHAGRVGALEGEHVGPVGHDGDHLGREVAASAGVEDRLQVRPVAGHHHHDPGRATVRRLHVETVGARPIRSR